MRYSHRFFLYAPFVLLLLIAAGVMIWWNVAAESFDKHLEAANGGEIMPGVRMSYASKSVSGFPFNLDTVLDGFTLEVQTRTGPFIWRAENFAMHALTYGRDQQIFEAAGTQTLTWTDSVGVQHRFSFVPGSLRASAIVSNGSLSRFDFDAVAVNSPELDAARIQFHIRREPDRDALQFVIGGDNVRLAPDLRAGFGELLKEVNIEGRISPEFPLQPLLAGQWDWRAAVDNWRQTSGYLGVQNLQIVWGRVRGTGSGRLSLDEWHRPQGFLNVDISGVSLTSLQPSSDAKLATAIASLAQGAQRDETGHLSSTIAVYHGMVSVGPRKPENIVIAVDGNGRVTWNGAPIAFEGLSDRFRSALGTTREAGAINPLY